MDYEQEVHEKLDLIQKRIEEINNELKEILYAGN